MSEGRAVVAERRMEQIYLKNMSGRKKIGHITHGLIMLAMSARCRVDIMTQQASGDSQKSSQKFFPQYKDPDDDLLKKPRDGQGKV